MGGADGRPRNSGVCPITRISVSNIQGCPDVPSNDQAAVIILAGVSALSDVFKPRLSPALITAKTQAF